MYVAVMAKPVKNIRPRYICALTADFHRTIQEGGWCGNPRDHLRVVYECNPLAFVVRACGGRASDGERDILDIIPSVFHENTPFFAGSSEDIDEVEKYGKSVPGGVKQTEGVGIRFNGCILSHIIQRAQLYEYNIK